MIVPVPAVTGIVVRLSAMLGVGVFAGLSPATSAAGGWALAGVLLAGAAALVVLGSGAGPVPPGVAGRVTGGLALGGYALAAAAVAGAFGAYAMPQRPLLGALGVLLVVAAALVARLRLPSWPTVLGLVFLLASLGVVVAVCFAIEPVTLDVYLGGMPPGVPGADDPGGVPAAAGVMVTGVTLAGLLGIRGRTGAAGRPGVLVLVTTGVAVAVLAGALRQLDGPRLALSPAPLRSALAAADASILEPLVTVAAGIGAVSALWVLLGGLRDTVLAMADAGDLPSGLAAEGRAGLPALAGCLAAGAVAALVPPAEAVGVAGCLVLVRFAVTCVPPALGAGRGTPRVLAVLGFGLCLFVAVGTAVAFPASVVLVGVVAVVAVVSRVSWRAGRG